MPLPLELPPSCLALPEVRNQRPQSTRTLLWLVWGVCRLEGEPGTSSRHRVRELCSGMPCSVCVTPAWQAVQELGLLAGASGARERCSDSPLLCLPGPPAESQRPWRAGSAEDRRRSGCNDDWGARRACSGVRQLRAWAGRAVVAPLWSQPGASLQLAGAGGTLGGRAPCSGCRGQASARTAQPVGPLSRGLCLSRARRGCSGCAALTWLARRMRADFSVPPGLS